MKDWKIGRGRKRERDTRYSDYLWIAGSNSTRVGSASRHPGCASRRLPDFLRGREGRLENTQSHSGVLCAFPKQTATNSASAPPESVERPAAFEAVHVRLMAPGAPSKAQTGARDLFWHRP